MKSVKITKENHSKGLKHADDAVIVRGKQFNDLLDDLNAHIPSDGVGMLDYLVPKSGNNLEILGLKVDPNYVNGNVELTHYDSGKIFWVNDASPSSVITLPAATVPGVRFKLIFTADNNNLFRIQTADLTDTTGDMFRGGLLVHSAAAVNTFVEATGDVNTVQLDNNLGNAGGGIGSWVEVVCYTAGFWFVSGVVNGNSQPAGTGALTLVDED